MALGALTEGKKVNVATSFLRKLGFQMSTNDWNCMARISYQNSTFRSFYKFDIRLLNWTFVLFISTFVLFASAFVFQGEHSFYINNIRFSKWTFA